jgi:hypothetical protein
MKPASLLLAVLLLTQHIALSQESNAKPYDVVVYGGTASGVIAAIQARKMGKSVVLIEPTDHLGGLTTSGLGATDIGNKGAIGGLAREFYRRIKAHYDRPESWRQEKSEDYRSGRDTERAGEDAIWTFEPHVAEKILDDWTREAGVIVWKNERLAPTKSVTKTGASISQLRLELGKSVAGRYFIDASYEGDLLSAAGASFHVGREANAVYGETINGVQVKNAVEHQFARGVDPYLKKGDKSSGLLPGIHGGGPGVDGEGDHRVQAYNFRMCLTDAPDNRMPIEKPADYDELRYELLFRNFEAGESRTPWNPILMPNRKTDINNNYGFSTDFIGESYDYPNGDYATREKIVAKHVAYQKGLIWTLANHPRVPEKIRKEVSRWGLCKDEFQETGGWPRQIYVREARRLIGEVVMTQHHCQGGKVAEDSVGLAAYTMDSHNVQRYVNEKGEVRNEGDVQVGGFSPYPISYRSLLPKRAECDNLLVPVCLSASHIAYGSIRMEPVFMLLGQSSATAACLAIDEKTALHDLAYEKLRAKLLADHQALDWKDKRESRGHNPQSFEGIVLDDESAEYIGDWTPSSSTLGFVGHGYRHDGNEKAGQKSAKFVFASVKPGKYQLAIAYTAHPNRAMNAPVTTYVGSLRQTKSYVNQRGKPPEVIFAPLCTLKISKSEQISVLIETTGADGYVVVDAVQLLEVK